MSACLWPFLEIKKLFDSILKLISRFIWFIQDRASILTILIKYCSHNLDITNCFRRHCVDVAGKKHICLVLYLPNKGNASRESILQLAIFKILI